MDRIKIIQVIFFIAAAIIVIRLFYWQFIAEINPNTILGLQDIKIPAPRGEIYASDGFPLVANQEAFLLYARLTELDRNPQEIAKLLAPHLISEKYSTPGAQLEEELTNKKEKEEEEEKRLSEQLSNDKLIWVQLARKVPLETKQKIEALKIKGIDFENDNKRYYPEASMAAQLLGFVASDKFCDDIGYFGLEGYYDSQLKTGKIIAMATYPTYNPALFTEFEESAYKNQAVADTYEPGSTFKLVTMSAALDSGVVKPDTKCTVCTGPRAITGHVISTWNNKYFPDSTMTEVIEHSDNIGMTFVADELGKDRLYDYIDKFGFGKRTEIDLQEESKGDVRDKDEWRPIDIATASFGQGLAVTPIQMVQAVQVIANGGKLIPPKVVGKIVENGKEKIVKSERENQVISAKTAALITEMMVSAVVNGEAKAFAPKGYRR